MTFTEFSEYKIFTFNRAASRSARVHPLTKKLRSFVELPVGWSHGEGVPVANAAVRVAEHFVEVAAMLQLKADAFPGLQGECSVAFYFGDNSVEVVIHPQRLDKFDLHVEVGRGFQFQTLVEKED